MSERVDAIVIGAGVVGLATARALALKGREVIVLEKNKHFGEETSSRNSEVIHAGIQYKPGGMRSQLAVKGRDALYAYCAERGVEHLRCGKLLVGRGNQDMPRLQALKERAEQNGVDDLEMISAQAARDYEPNVLCEGGAIYSPSSGIVDSHNLMLSFLGDIENEGGMLVLNAPVTGGRVSEDGITIDVGGDEPMSLTATTVVNSGGLWSDRVARSITGIPDTTIPTLHFARGIYFTYSGKAPFSRLIYPLPSSDSQGIHYTRDLGGQGRLGPDIEFIDSNTDYTVDAGRLQIFAEAAKSFWPDLDPERLVPGYAGIRPKLRGPGEEGDFYFSDASIHGIPGYLGLYGIESPGLTTCLAVADHAASLLS